MKEDNYYDRLWKMGYVKREFFDFKWKWPLLKRMLPDKDFSTVLDYGCGEGKYIKEISTFNPTYKIIGTDISNYVIKKAKKRFPNFKFITIKDSNILSIEKESLDFIFAGDVIEHILDTEGFVRQLSRVLKSGGRILITTPYNSSIKTIIISLIAFDTYFSPTGPHIRFFTKNTLSKLVRKNNLKIIEYGEYGRFWPLSQGMYILAEKGGILII